MSFIQYAKNIYFKGQEQTYKRPYLVVFQANSYILGFPLTTKSKLKKTYPSHQNPLITTQTSQGLQSNEVMIDQLTLIPLQNLKNNPQPCSLPIPNEYPIVIDSFVQQLTTPNTNFTNQNHKCPNFFDTISFIHTNPILNNATEYCVVSSSHFNVFTTMCLIAPIQNNGLNLDYLHCISWKARKVQILGNTNYINQTIQTLQQDIRSKF